jgi:DNA (cytosine-5)-methyltransferase 1
MTHASLFSGIGGFDLAAEWMGWENIFHCEWNPFGQKVLAHHFPNSKSYNDITKTDFSLHSGEIDILTGGFPCQPYSTAGKRLGKADERHLFPHMLRCIKEVKPKWVIGENVRGLVNWNGGMVFHEVCNDLEREGYEVQPFLIPAASVNAPHQRQRIFFIAYSNDKGRSRESREIQKEDGKISERNNYAKPGNTSDAIVTNSNGFGRGESIRISNTKSNVFDKISTTRNVTNSECVGLDISKKTRDIYISTRETQEKWSEFTKSFEANGGNGNASNSKSKGYKRLYETRIENNINRENTKIWGNTTRYNKENNFINFPTKSPICGGDDGIPRELDSITFPKWRNESIKAYGNAIVPQVAYEIFKAIQSFEDMVNF